MMVMVFLLAGSSACSTLNAAPARDRQIVTEVLASFQELVSASKALDAKRYFACFDREKFTGLNSQGKVWHSIADLEKVILPGFSAVDKIVSLEFFNVKVSVINPSTAILVNEYKEAVLLKDGSLVRQSGGGSQVWSKSNNAWKLVSVSESEAARE